MLALLALAACGSDSDKVTPGPALLDEAALMDPASCASCHSVATQQWSGSMHAYAADDPIFRAQNARAQRETKGANGTFCVQCHAPVAVRTGATLDGLNLAQLPASLRGVTCYACHQISAIRETHNAGFDLARDGAMRGGIADPAPGAPHQQTYSALHDRTTIASSSLCGSCHDIHTPLGAEAARTHAEWQGSLYAHDVAGQRLTCGNCHMPATAGVAANVSGAPTRQVHDHSMPGVDVALTPFPEQAAQRTLVQANLDPSLILKLCVRAYNGRPNVDVSLDAAFVGHAFPSGASYNRRAWVELVASAAGRVVHQSGVVAAGQDVTRSADSDLWILQTKLLTKEQTPAPSLWQAAATAPNLLPPAVTSNPLDPAYYHSVLRSYLVPPETDQIAVQVRVLPIGLDVVDALITSGDLDAKFRSLVPIFSLAATKVTWTKDKGYRCLPN